MKLLLIASSLALATLIGPAEAASDYMTVSSWEKCVVINKQEFYNFSCLPEKQPAGCPESSWQALKQKQSLPGCPLCPPKKK